MTHTVLQTGVENAAAEVSKLSHQRYGELWEAYEISCVLLSQLAEQGARDPDGKSPFEVERLSLTANLLQGCFIVESLISSGYYVASIALLRQHMETLARIIELRTGKEIHKHKTPNVKCLPFRLSHNYGRLSEIFHTSKGEYLTTFAEIVEDEKVASFLPQFKEDWSSILFAVHIAHLVTLAREIHELHEDLYVQDPAPAIDAEFQAIATILVATKFWERFDQ